MTGRTIVSLTAIACVLALLAPAARGDQFTDPDAWDTYDFPGDGRDGFMGPAYDYVHGYVYFAPYAHGANGKVLRYNVNADFSTSSAWQEFNVCAEIGANGGYSKAAFAVCGDDAYVYFIPYHTTSTIHGEVVRYDTNAPFDDAGSWDIFDIEANCPAIGCSHGRGFHGSVVVDGHLYLVPHRTSGDTAHGEACRYDLSAAFGDTSSWECYEYSESPECTGDPECRAKGYAGACSDGRYVFFVPESDAAFVGDKRHGEVMRYDTQGDFESAESWTTYDPGARGLDEGPPPRDLDGYAGCACDDSHVYFAPAGNQDGVSHGNVLRYDIAGDFETLASWEAYDVAAPNPVGAVVSYAGVLRIGCYLYFVPYSTAADRHGQVLRLDTECGFYDPSCWETYDYGSDPDGCALDPNCNDPDGYHGAATDGRYIYFAQLYNGTSYGGEILRHDTGPDCNENGIPDGCEADFDGDGCIDDCECLEGCDCDIDNDGVQDPFDVCDYTPLEAANIIMDPTSCLYGTIRRDLDGDCDCDLEDFSILQTDFTGPSCTE